MPLPKGLVRFRQFMKSRRGYYLILLLNLYDVTTDVLYMFSWCATYLCDRVFFGFYEDTAFDSGFLPSGDDCWLYVSGDCRPSAGWETCSGVCFPFAMGAAVAEARPGFFSFGWVSCSVENSVQSNSITSYGPLAQVLGVLFCMVVAKEALRLLCVILSYFFRHFEHTPVLLSFWVTSPWLLLVRPFHKQKLDTTYERFKEGKFINHFYDYVLEDAPQMVHILLTGILTGFAKTSVVAIFSLIGSLTSLLVMTLRFGAAALRQARLRATGKDVDKVVSLEVVQSLEGRVKVLEERQHVFQEKCGRIDKLEERVKELEKH